ncbi:helix-turn-helix domain-containing protein [Hwanghaeella sp.]|uniref:helix-turn-helix domain-containing protein n=1 Tax=Hwanghaeella sp. TaxID=2605943 RepID=UPI003CCB8A7D
MLEEWRGSKQTQCATDVRVTPPNEKNKAIGSGILDQIDDNSVLLLTAAKAAARLGIPLRSFNRLVTKGEIPFVAISNRRYFVPDDLLTFIEQRRVLASPSPQSQPARLTRDKTPMYDFEAIRRERRSGKQTRQNDT